MSFEPRPFADIVRDVLTTLTGGTIRERVVVPAGDGPIELTRLAHRPIRRISHMQGRVRISDDPETGELDYRFTPADYELVASDGSEEPDRVLFRPQGRHPVPGSELIVNYYPFDIPPEPLSDLNVGSVIRTLLESVSAELAYEEQLLDQVYRSAFIETAEGKDLDRVVALVGVKRFPAGIATARVRFTRTPGSMGRITVPAGVVVTDAPGENRYATTVPLTLEPGEQARDVLAAAADARTDTVSAGALDRLEVLIAGIGAVRNEAAVAAAQAETDEALRRRARSALRATARGTLEALQYGLRGVDGVKDVAVSEFPNGVAGEVRVDVIYERDSEDTRTAVRNRVDLLRPAGIRVLLGDAARLRVAVTVAAELTDDAADAAERAEITGGIEDRIASVVEAVAPGGLIRNAPLVAAALADARVADAQVTLAAEGGAPVDKLQLGDGVAAELVRPFTITLPAAATAGSADVDLTLPLMLEPGVTRADAESAIRLAVEAHLATRSPTAPLDVDGLAANIRDESRYGLVREEAVASVEAGGRFAQLTDGLGVFAPDPGQTLRLRTLALDIREGAT